MQLIENAPNTIFIDRYFRWNLIKSDPDDNKFLDCAIASNANYLVTHDRHFNILDSMDFPKIKIISASQFINVLSVR